MVQSSPSLANGSLAPASGEAAGGSSTAIVSRARANASRPSESTRADPAIKIYQRKRQVVLGEGTHSVCLEKNRMQFIQQVQSFLYET